MDEFEKECQLIIFMPQQRRNTGDTLGPTFDMLRRTKNCREIIESASRPNENLDKRLTFDGFQAWYLERAGLLGE